MQPDWYVVLRPDEKPIYKMSMPACRTGSISARNASGFTALVDAGVPARRAA